KHFWREVDAIDDGGATLPEPCPAPPRAACQIEHQARRRPVDRLQLVEQAQVHLVLHGLLIRMHPCAVAFPHVDDWVSAFIVDRVVHTCSSRTFGTGACRSPCRAGGTTAKPMSIS